jgi:peptide/nickel transport system substrate-binding protein
MVGYSSRVPAGRRLSRRALVRGGVLTAGGVATAVALACGGEKKQGGTTGAGGAAGAAPTTAPGQEPKAGGEWRGGGTGVIAGVDPHNSVYGGAGIVPIVYSYLVRTSLLAPDRGVLPELATAWEQLPDKVTTVFRLRSDAMIHENTRGVPVRPIDAEDVKASFERVADPRAAANGFSWMNRWVDKLEAVDKTTFRLVTKEPYAWTLHNVGNNLYSAIVPREWLASADLKKWAIGSGPYVLQSAEEGVGWSVVRHPNFYEKPKPYIATRTQKIFGDVATARTAFATGQTDSFGPQNSDEARDILKQRSDAVFYQDPSLGFHSFWMNTRIKPFDDPRVRRAIRRAVNPDEYIAIITRGDGVVIGALTYALKDYALSSDEVKRLLPYNPQEARQLLQAAGQANLVLKPEFATNLSADEVNIFTRQMQVAGVTVEGVPLDPGTWLSNLFNSKPVTSFHPNQEYATPDFALQFHVTGGITGNGKYDTGFSDPQVDADWKRAATILDEKERIKAYQDLQRLIISKDMADFHFYASKSNLLVTNALMNLQRGIGALGYYYYKDLWLNR